MVEAARAEQARRAARHAEPQHADDRRRPCKLLRDGIIGDVLVAKCWNSQRRGTIGHGRGRRSAGRLRLRHLGRPGPDGPLSVRNRCHNAGTGGTTSAPATWATTASTTSITRAGAWASTRIPTRSPRSAASTSSTTTSSSPTRSRWRSSTRATASRAAKRKLIYEQRIWSHELSRTTATAAPSSTAPRGRCFSAGAARSRCVDDRKQSVAVGRQARRAERRAARAELLRCHSRPARLNADALTGHLSTSLCHLGNIATRLGRSLTFDPQTERFVGDDEANALVRREYRDHWGTPRST